MLNSVIFLLLLGVANGTPVLVKLALGSRYARPLDAGLTLRDGYRLFGVSKTLRGIGSSFLATALVTAILGYGWSVGVGIAAAAMAGDLVSSFTKRRLGLQSSHDVYGLDQIPESFFPGVLYRHLFQMSWINLMLVVVVFFVLDVVLTEWVRRLESRSREK